AAARCGKYYVGPGSFFLSADAPRPACANASESLCRRRLADQPGFGKLKVPACSLRPHWEGVQREDTWLWTSFSWFESLPPSHEICPVFQSFAAQGSATRRVSVESTGECA